METQASAFPGQPSPLLLSSQTHPSQIQPFLAPILALSPFLYPPRPTGWWLVGCDTGWREPVLEESVLRPQGFSTKCPSPTPTGVWKKGALKREVMMEGQASLFVN